MGTYSSDGMYSTDCDSSEEEDDPEYCDSSSDESGESVNRRSISKEEDDPEYCDSSSDESSESANR